MAKPKNGLGAALCTLVKRVFPNNFSDEVRAAKEYQGLEFLAVHLEALQENAERDRALAEQTLTKRADEYERRLHQQVEELHITYAEIDATNQEFDILHAEHSKLKQAIPETKILALRMLRAYQDVAHAADIQRLRADAIYKREEEAGRLSAARELLKWQQFSEARLKEQAEKAEAVARAFAAQNFSFAINFAIKTYPRIPFAYYDFSNRTLYHTQAAAELLGREETTSDRLTLKGLMGYLARDGRHEVFEALKRGEKLEHYVISSSGELPVELRLTTHPLVYDDKIIGTGIFLYDPRFSFKKLGTWRLAHRVDKAFAELREDISRFRNGLAKKQPDLAYIALPPQSY